MKKKITLTITALVLVAALSTMAAFAAGNGNRSFVDADNDGVCDNRGNCNFVDVDNDGVCDNRGTGVRSQDGTGRQWGRNK